MQSDYSPRVDNEQGLLRVRERVWGKIFPQETSILSCHSVSRKFLLKIFHTGNCEWNSWDGHINFPGVPITSSITLMNALTPFQGSVFSKNIWYTKSPFGQILVVILMLEPSRKLLSRLENPHQPKTMPPLYDQRQEVTFGLIVDCSSDWKFFTDIFLDVLNLW